jgi:perosamine synthetase
MGMIKVPELAISYFNSNYAQIISSGNLAEGQWNEKLTGSVVSISGQKYAVPTCSNGAGMMALLQIYKEYYGRKKVMIQSNTMYGVKTMVKSGGHELVGYIDCQLETLMPKLGDVESAVESYNGQMNELIILLSDIGGIINPDAEQIADYCKAQDIIFLEDCAHSFGASLNNKQAGTFGNAGVYSFYATKAVFAGEGGVVITGDEKLAELVKGYTIYDRFEQKMQIGVNIRLPEIQALMIFSVIKYYRNIIETKKQIAEKYIEICNEFNISYIDQESKNLIGNYYKFILLSEDKRIGEYLPNLQTKTSAVYDYFLGSSNTIAEHHCCLPIWFGQEEEITETVICELRQSMSNL